MKHLLAGLVLAAGAATALAATPAEFAAKFPTGADALGTALLGRDSFSDASKPEDDWRAAPATSVDGDAGARRHPTFVEGRSWHGDFEHALGRDRADDDWKIPGPSVPEPSSWVLTLPAILAFGAWRLLSKLRRRDRQRA